MSILYRYGTQITRHRLKPPRTASSRRRLNLIAFVRYGNGVETQLSAPLPNPTPHFLFSSNERTLHVGCSRLLMRFPRPRLEQRRVSTGKAYVERNKRLSEPCTIHWLNASTKWKGKRCERRKAHQHAFLTCTSGPCIDVRCSALSPCA